MPITGNKISAVHGRKVWDSRGRPTVEAEITLAGGAVGRAIAPAGASTGTAEALDRRDGGSAFGGHGVSGAITAVSNEIAPRLKDLDATDQAAIDAILIELDGTPNKGRLGSNAIVATSMAVAHAAAAAQDRPLWAYLASEREDLVLPLPEIQIFGGGAHAARRIDIQDLMIIAVGAKTYAQALDWTAEVYRTAAALMAEAGLLAGVADEGGFWPAFDSNEAALDMLSRAIERAGFAPGAQIAISLDIAASEFGADGRYRLSRDARELDRDDLLELLQGWVAKYPIISIEDPFAEDDPNGLAAITQSIGMNIQIVGDDYLVTDADRIEAAAAAGICNSVLLKPNQCGTLSETRAAYKAAKTAGWGAIISARSGETEDVTIMHLAVGWGVPQLKVGSFARSERMAKWNEGLRIADALNQDGGHLPPPAAFPWSKQ